MTGLWTSRRRRFGAVAASAVLLLAACGDDGDEDEGGGETEASGDTGDVDDAVEASDSDDGATGGDGDMVFPGDEWDEADPEEMGFDPAVLEELAGDAAEYDTQCLVVTRDGQLVAEWYWDDTGPETPLQAWSVTKSYTAGIVGLAVGDGDLDLDEPVSTYVEEWQGTESEDVTVRNLVSNDSGRSWMMAHGFDESYVALTGAPDRTGHAIEAYHQENPPGASWEYNDGAIQVLDTVVEQATGRSPAELAQERILDPIGAADSEMQVDEAGGTAMYFDLRTTCRDMARYGHLMLNDGVWDGEQVLPEGWVEQATTPSQELNAAYGYLWWLNATGVQAGATGDGSGSEEAEEGRMVPDAPEDMYWAQGLGGQTIQVHPGTDTVVTRMDADTDSGYGSPDTARFVTEAIVGD